MAIKGGNVGFTGYQQPNYSGVVQAAGLPMQAIGQGIAQAEDYFKQQGEKKKLIKQSDIQIDAALKLFPDLAPTLQGVRDQIKDENISLNERAGIAESVAGLINMGTKQMQANAEFGLQERQVKLQEQRARAEQIQMALGAQAEANRPIEKKPDTMIINGMEVDVLRDKIGNIYDPQSLARIVDPKGFAEGRPAEQVLEQFDASGFPIMPQSGGVTPNNMGELLPGLAPQLPSEQQAVVDAGGAAYPDGVAVAGTPLADAGAIQRAADLSVAPNIGQFTPRGRPIREEGFRDFTPEEVVKYGSPGQVNLKNKEVKLLPPPSGRSWKVSPDGTVEVIEGAGVGAGTVKAEAATKAQKEQSFERSRAIIGSASKIIPQIQSALSANPLIARGQQTLGQVFPAGETGRIASDLETIRVQTSKEEINKLRASSPTGTAGGTITEKEWPKFENRFGKMEVGMYPPDLMSNIQKTALNQFESVNGTPEDVIKLFNDGKILKPVFDEYLKEYKQTRAILGISDNGTGGPGDEWTKYNPNLLRFDKEKQRQLSPEAQAMQDRINALKANP